MLKLNSTFMLHTESASKDTANSMECSGSSSADKKTAPQLYTNGGLLVLLMLFAHFKIYSVPKQIIYYHNVLKIMICMIIHTIPSLNVPSDGEPRYYYNENASATKF